MSLSGVDRQRLSDGTDRHPGSVPGKSAHLVTTNEKGNTGPWGGSSNIWAVDAAAAVKSPNNGIKSRNGSPEFLIVARVARRESLRLGEGKIQFLLKPCPHS